MADKGKLIIYLGGGAMSGTYGAGVLKGIQENNFTDSIESIYAGSVGVVNAAYLLSQQPELGPTVYFEDLQKGFIYPWNLFIGTWDLVKNRFIKPIKKEAAHNVVDINYVCNIFAQKKKIDLEVIAKNTVGFYIKVLNIDTGEVEYKNFKDYPTLNLIRAGITVKPYFFEETKIEGKRYIDATMKEPLGIEYLLNRYPGRKIVVILNEPIKRGLRHYLKNIVEGLVSSLYPYEISLFKFFLKREGLLRKDIKICLNNKERVLLLHPYFTGRARPRSTNLAVLKKTFEYGKSDSIKILEFINK